jgi:hypothetical protein
VTAQGAAAACAAAAAARLLLLLLLLPLHARAAHRGTLRTDSSLMSNSSVRLKSCTEPSGMQQRQQQHE